MDKVNTLPNLFIVGAAKSGTTSLHNYLNQHSDVFMCTPKEPHFLINNEIGKDRIPIGICSENEYLEAVDAMPKEIDWEELSIYESEDHTRGSQEYACTGDKCEVVDLK